MASAIRVGFIGLGMMGRGMARNILAKGFPLAVLGHRNRAAVDDLVARGATERDTPRALAEAAEVVVACVTGAPQVEELVYRPSGILEAARPGFVLVDATTSQPGLTRRIARDLAARGAAVVDAPVTRSPKDAEAGRLNSLVGADAAILERVRPVLDAYSETVTHFGPVGAGHTAKLVNNFITMGYVALWAEAMAICAGAGVDQRKFYAAASQGAADSGTARKMIPPFLDGDLGGHKFAVANGLKDVSYFATMAAELEFDSAMAPALLATYQRAVAAGFGDKLMASMMELHEQATGWPVVPRKQ